MPNYGWPISSYGDHYDGRTRKEAPLNKSHSKFGFIEPIKYFIRQQSNFTKFLRIKANLYSNQGKKIKFVAI